MKKYPPMELATTDKQALAALSYHEGFKVLVKIMERRVQTATARMLEIAPDTPNRDQLLKDFQADAFGKNAFCAELLEEINWHRLSLDQDEEEPETAQQKNLRAAMEAVGYVRN